MKLIDWISIQERKLLKLNEKVLICQTFVNGSKIVRLATFVKKDGEFGYAGYFLYQNPNYRREIEKDIDYTHYLPILELKL